LFFITEGKKCLVQKKASHAKWHEQFVSFRELLGLGKDNLLKSKTCWHFSLFFFFGKGVFLETKQSGRIFFLFFHLLGVVFFNTKVFTSDKILNFFCFSA